MLLWLYYIEFKIQNPNGSIALTTIKMLTVWRSCCVRRLDYIEFKIQSPNGSIALTHHQSLER